MSFSYDISVRVNQPLTTVSSSLFKLGFCTSLSSTVTPPLLQIAVAGSGTANTDAVQAKCYTVGTTSVTLVAADPFGTNAAATYVFLKENSGSPASHLVIQEDAESVEVMRLLANDSAFFRRGGGAALSAYSTSSSSTASVQVIIVGE